VALLIGYPTLRHKGFTFAIITFAFAEIVRLLIATAESLGATGGSPMSRAFTILSISFKSGFPFTIYLWPYAWSLFGHGPD